jgi:citrate lyase subunit beta / citryl-CoA lyase
MPASNARAIEKARNITADVIILDLEDAVAPNTKIEARASACRAAAEGGFGPRELVIRTNALDTVWGHDDLRAAATSGADALLVPKVTSATDIQAIHDAMDVAGAPANMALWVMIEMPLAILNIAEIARAALTTRLTALVIGTNDLAKELHAQNTPDPNAVPRAAFQNALQMSVTAARAYGLSAIDGVFNDITDLAGLEQECLQGRMFGYDGKTAIHPAQLDLCNRIFSPCEEEIAQARAIIAAFAAPENAGQAVIKVGGKMAELLHLEQAQQTVAIAEKIIQLTD